MADQVPGGSSGRNIDQSHAPPGVNGWLVLILLILVAGLAYQLATQRTGALFNPNAAPREIVPRGDLADDEKSTIEIFNVASPSVVYITNLAVRRDSLSLNILEIPQGTGSGFVWDADGHIVTNFHVVKDANLAKVTLSDHTTWDARLVGVEPDKDLAVIKIDAPGSNLRPIPVGESSDLQVGQKVFAIGNPFGLDQTLTTGVISGLGREILSVTQRPIQGVIQTDAAINPGNSGGPLLDSAGRLIGVNTAIYSPSGTYAGVGFAVPVDIVNRIVPQLIRTGKVERIGLGITVVDPTVVKRAGLTGVLVQAVVKGGGAEKAGIVPTRRDDEGNILLGDLIIAIDGDPVSGLTDLYRVLDRHHVGDTVAVTVKRGDATEEVQVTLQAIPS